MAVSAADCAGLQPGVELHGGGDANQTLRPSLRSSAVSPPPSVGLSVKRAGSFGSPSVRGNSDDVGDGGVDVAIVAGHAPLHAAVHAALADARLPDDLALLRRDRARRPCRTSGPRSAGRDCRP